MNIQLTFCLGIFATLFAIGCRTTIPNDGSTSSLESSVSTSSMPDYVCSLPAKQQTEGDLRYPTQMLGFNFNLHVSKQDSITYSFNIDFQDTDGQSISGSIPGIKDGRSSRFIFPRSKILGAKTEVRYSESLARGVKKSVIHISLDQNEFSEKNLDKFIDALCVNKVETNSAAKCAHFGLKGNYECKRKKTQSDFDIGNFKLSVQNENKIDIWSSELNKSFSAAWNPNYKGSKLGTHDFTGWCEVVGKNVNFDGASCNSFVFDPSASSTDGDKNGIEMVVKCAVESGGANGHFHCTPN